jgi:hypothetical protein
VLGGGFSATLGITDSHNYNAVSEAAKELSNGTAAEVESLATPGYNNIVYVGNVRYDQSWGSVQVMAAGHTGGNLSQVSVPVDATYATDLTSVGIKKSGYAVGVGATFKLPMLAAGDEIQLTAVYADRLANLLADSGINTPSAAAYGTNPVGGPGAKFANGTGWVVGAQLRHYWTSAFRSQVYVSYTSREQHFLTGGVKGTGEAYTVGKAFIYTPAKDLDIGLEFNYVRASWNQAAANSVTTYTGAPAGGIDQSNLVSKLRIQRNF